MHEFSIATGIVEVVREEATAHGADRVESMTIAVGEASHVNREQLETCLEVAVEGTLAAEATVDIESVEPYGTCACGWEGAPETSDRALAYAPDLRCPECEDRIELDRGDGCRVMELTVPSEEEGDTNDGDTNDGDTNDGDTSDGETSDGETIEEADTTS